MRLCEALTQGTEEREEQAAKTQVIVTKEILERLKSLLQGMIVLPRAKFLFELTSTQK